MVCSNGKSVWLLPFEPQKALQVAQPGLCPEEPVVVPKGVPDAHRRVH